MTGIPGGITWLIISVILFVIESVTVQLVCVWFAFGALVSMAASLLGASFDLQLAVFLITSVVVLVLGRPFLKGRLTPKKTATNADAVIGKTGIVTEGIDNINMTGRVRANGLEWTARSASDRVIVAAGQKVKVMAIEGVKLIVEPIIQEEVAWNLEDDQKTYSAAGSK